MKRGANKRKRDLMARLSMCTHKDDDPGRRVDIQQNVSKKPVMPNGVGDSRRTPTGEWVSDLRGVRIGEKKVNVFLDYGLLELYWIGARVRSLLFFLKGP